MGLLVEGTWKDRWYDTDKTGGRFVRSETQFRDTIGGEDGRFPAEAGRYRLYVAAACPWAHRTLLYRALKGLEDVIAVTWVEPDMLENGWSFSEDKPDPLYDSDHLYQIYTRADPDYSGRVTVPVLWDEKTETIVNNESAEVIRIFDTAFDDLADASAPFAGVSLCPAELQEDIDAINERVYDHVNNGVYKAGFATTQEAYEEAVTGLFDTLDHLEGLLSERRYLLGDQLTEADVRLFPTLLRFDPVYHVHFKCCRQRIVDYPNLWAYTRELYQLPRVASTIKMDEIRRHYFYSHESINPHRIVPIRPEADLTEPHGRG